MHSLSNQKISFEKRTFSWFHYPLIYQEMKNQICIYFLSMAKRKTVFWNQETHFRLFTAVFSQWSTFTADCLLWKLHTLTVINPCWDACSFCPFSKKKKKKKRTKLMHLFFLFLKQTKKKLRMMQFFFSFHWRKQNRELDSVSWLLAADTVKQLLLCWI